MWAPVILLTLAASGVRVEAGTACPALADVQARLQALLPGAPAGGADADVARIVDADGAVRITLLAPDGATLGERVLERGFPCEDLAAAAAVVIATWETDVHPEFAARLEVAAPPPEPPPAPALVRVATPPPPVAVPPAWSLGAGVLGTLAPSGGDAHPAGGARLDAAWLGAGGHWGTRLGLSTTASRRLALPSGTAAWRRTAVSAGVLRRLTAPGRPLAFDLHAELLGAWLSITGSGFPTNHDAAAFDVGAALTARLALGGGTLRPWLELGGAVWPRAQVVFEQPSGQAAALPRWEAGLALGVSVWLGS